MTVHLNPPLKGMGFTRFCIAAALVKNLSSCALVAEERWPGSFAATAIRKAAAAGLSPSAAWGAELAAYETQAAEFFIAVREQSTIGQMLGLRRVSLGVRVVSQTAATEAGWVGEQALKLVTEAIFAASRLEPRRVSAITVQTDELIRLSDPDAEITIRNDLVGALAAAIDVAFLDPANAGVPDVKPAAATYGAPAVVSTGNATDDIAALIAAFEGDLGRAYFVAQPETLVLFSNGDNLDIGARGGSLKGIPAVSSRNAPAETLAIIDAGAIAYGSRLVEIQTAREGNVIMENGSGGELVSLWQNNLVAIQVEQTINWSAGANTAAVLTGIGGS